MSHDPLENSSQPPQSKPIPPVKKGSRNTGIKRLFFKQAMSTEVLVASLGCLGTVITALLGGIFLLASQDKLNIFSRAEPAATETQIVLTATALPVAPELPTATTNNEPNNLQDVFRWLVNHGEQVKGTAFTADAGWIVWHGLNSAWWDGIPTPVEEHIQEVVDAGEEIKQVAFAPNGGWVVLYGKNAATWISLPLEAENKLNELYQADADIRWIAFTPTSGWVIIYNNNRAAWVNIPEAVQTELDRIQNAGESITCIAFTPQGGSVIVYSDGVWLDHVPVDLENELTRLYNAGEQIHSVAFHPQGGWVVNYGVNRTDWQDIPDQ